MHKKLVFVSLMIYLATLLLVNAVFAQQIDVPYGDSKTIDLQKNIARILSSDQDIAVAEILAMSKLKIAGTGIGSTFIYVWWEDGSYSVLKVNVFALRPSLAELLQTDSKSKQQENIKFELTGVSYGGQSDSNYLVNRWAYGGFFTGLRMFGQTNLGQTNSYINYEGYNGSYGLTRFSLNFKGDDYYFDIGDGEINLSELSLSHLHYQGFQYKKDLTEQISFLLVTGARGQNYWGRSALRDMRPAQKFIAFQSTYKPVKQLSIDFRVITSSTEGVGVKNDIIGLSARYSPDYWLTLLGDFAKSGDDTSVLTQIDYNDRGLFLRGQYKSIPSTFIAPSDFYNQRGIEGIFLYGSHFPFSFIRLSGQATRYKNYSLQLPNSDYNSDFSANLELIVDPNFSVVYNPWQNDQRGFTNGGLSQGTLLQATYTFPFGGLSNVFLRYQPSKFTGSNTTESDYLSDRTTIGSRIGISDALFLDVENEWNKKEPFLSAISKDGRIFKAILNYNSKIGQTPFYNNSKIYYTNGTDAGNPVSEIWAESEFSYRPSDDTKFYIKGKTANYSGSTSNPIDRTEKHLVFGFNTVVDSGIASLGHGSVQGYVFNDKNGNGIKDKDDDGIEGAKVFIKDGFSAYTGKDGWYEIKDVKTGKTIVYLDLTSIDSKYVLSSLNPIEVDVKAQQGSNVNFGAKKISSLKIRVFADSNGNKVFDVGDRSIAAFPIYVEDKKYITDYEGKVFVYDIAVGTYKISIDPKDISSKLLPLVPITNYVEVQDGGIYEFLMPMRSQKTTIIKTQTKPKKPNKSISKPKRKPAGKTSTRNKNAQKKYRSR